MISSAMSRSAYGFWSLASSIIDVCRSSTIRRVTRIARKTARFHTRERWWPIVKAANIKVDRG